MTSVYHRLPVPLQHVAVSAKGLSVSRRRYGGDYDAVERSVRARAKLREEKLRSYQAQRLRSHLKAANETSFWRRRFRTVGVDPEGEDIFRELRKLPVIGKADVRGEVQRIQPPDLGVEERQVHTSGTTGSGLVFRETLRAERERWATWWRYRSWHGIERGTWCGYFGGRQIVPVRQSDPPFWRVNWGQKQVRFSAYHLSHSTAPAYVAKLRSERIRWLHGYPSMIALLAGHMLEEDLPPLPDLQIITLGAESLMAHQREVIADAFGVPARQHYGLAESIANLSECPEGSLHVDEDFAHVEFLPTEGPEGDYRIVGSNWTNPAFPLFRYDTGDLATIEDGTCTCGRPGRVVTGIDGRREDYVTLPDGRQLGRLDHIFKDLVRIREAQVYQPDLGTVVLRVVRGRDFRRSEDEEELLKEARSRLGDAVDIAIEYVPHIERTDRGKLRFVVSDVTQVPDSGTASGSTGAAGGASSDE